MTTSTLEDAAPVHDVSTTEREVQHSYWAEHSKEPTVEAMMLDSKAAEIDQLERPEVSSNAKFPSALLGAGACPSRAAHAAGAVR